VPRRQVTEYSRTVSTVRKCHHALLVAAWVTAEMIASAG